MKLYSTNNRKSDLFSDSNWLAKVELTAATGHSLFNS